MSVFILVALAATVAGVPQDCTYHCKSLSPKSSWLPWCDCSTETQELIASDTPESSNILDSSPYHETDIYYEPDEGHLTVTKVLFQQPFYINNPTINLKLKSPKREVDNKPSLKVTINSPTEIDEIIIAHERPLYLDIGIEDSVRSRNPDEIEDIGPTESDLSECLDLHAVVFSRNQVTATLPSQIFSPETLKKYKTMSDADVIMAIKSKCTKSMELVNRILWKIQEAQPKKKYVPLITSHSLNNTPVESPVGSYRNLAPSADANSSYISYNISDKHKSELRATNVDIDDLQVDNATVITLDFAEELTTSNETPSDSYTSESKLISTRSTVGLTDTGILDNHFTPTTNDIVQDNVHNSSDEELTTDAVIKSATYNETTDSYLFIESNDTYTDGNEATDSDVSVIGGMTNYLEDNLPTNEDSTAQSTIEQYSIKDSATTYEVAAKSTTTESTPIPVAANGKSILTDSATTLPITYQDTSASQLFHTAVDNNIAENSYNDVKKTHDVSKKVTEPRQVLRESETMIPKILTKELANGSVVSAIQGYEVVPNGDFINNIDDSSYEDTSGIEDEQFSYRRTPDSNHVSQYKNGISGNLYFIFDQALIPARFLQSSDGLVSLGLNGNSMCKNFLKHHRDRSQFLLKLCKAVIDDQNDKNDKTHSVLIHDVKNNKIT